MDKQCEYYWYILPEGAKHSDGLTLTRCTDPGVGYVERTGSTYPDLNGQCWACERCKQTIHTQNYVNAEIEAGRM